MTDERKDDAVEATEEDLEATDETADDVSGGATQYQGYGKSGKTTGSRY